MVKNRMVGTLVITSLLFTPTNTVSTSTNVENEVTFNRINNDITPKIYNENYCKLKKEFETKQNIINRVNERFDKIEERHRQEEEKKRLEEEEERNSYDIDFELTFYSRHPSENGGFNCTSTGEPLREGIVANNLYPIGTRILLEDGREFVVADRGGKKYFDNYYRLDVFVDTYDVNYVNSLGRQKVKGKIIN